MTDRQEARRQVAESARRTHPVEAYVPPPVEGADQQPVPLFPMTASYARLSDDGAYRYALGRVWDSARPRMTFIMLNPSTADAAKDDPTIRRCIGFARREGYGGIHVVNLYAYRTPSPDELGQARDRGTDVIGPENDETLRATLDNARHHRSPVVAAWGARAQPDRTIFLKVLANARRVQLLALGTTQQHHPRHPLYVRGDADLARWP